MGARRLLFLLPLLAVLALAAVFAWSILSGRDPAMLPSAMIDRPVPAFTLAPIEGRDGPGLTAADLARGDGPILVNFFASWCVPCLAEHPVLTRLAIEEGMPLYGVNYKDAPADARRWLDRHGDPFTAIGADRDGRTGIEFGVYGIPETFLVDGAGRIRWRWAGPLTPQVVERDLMPLWRELGG